MEWHGTLICDVPVKTVPLEDGRGRGLTLDLYLPERGANHPAGPGAAPLLVYIHGGGWREGHNDRPPGYRTILERGLAIASLQYRYSMQGSGEEMVADLVDGVAVARREAGRRGCDVGRWFAWGISAGGHLCSLVAHRLAAGTTGDRRPHAPAAENRVPGETTSPPTAVASWCGVFDLARYATLHGVKKQLRATVREIVALLTHDDPDTMRALSPITYASPTSPPHIFVHGAEDRLVPPQQSRTMHEALTREGVRSELFEVAGRDHAMPPEDSEEMHRTLDFLLECPVGKETAP